jgi:surfactin synthase thioesterase subunit
MGTLFAFRAIQEIVSAGGPQPLLYFPSSYMSARSAKSSDELLNADHVLKALFGEGTPDSADASTTKRNITEDVALWRCIPDAREELLSIPIAAFVGGQDPIANESLVSTWEEHTSHDFSVTIFPGDHFYLRNGSQRLVVDTVANHISGRLANAEPNTPEFRRRSVTTFSS